MMLETIHAAWHEFLAPHADHVTGICLDVEEHRRLVARLIASERVDYGERPDDWSPRVYISRVPVWALDAAQAQWHNPQAAVHLIGQLHRMIARWRSHATVGRVAYLECTEELENLLGRSTTSGVEND